MSFSPETQQIIAEVERLSGRPVYVEEDPTLKVLANVTMARGAFPSPEPLHALSFRPAIPVWNHDLRQCGQRSIH